MHEIHHPRHSREPSVIPADAGTQRKTKHTAKPPLRAAKGTRAQHAGDARKPPTPPLRSSEHQDNPSIIPPTPSVIPASLTSFPQAFRHSREPSVIPADAGTQKKTKHTAKPPLRGAKGTRAQHAGDARKPPTPPLRSSEHQDNPSIIPPPPPSSPQALRHSRKPYVIPASHPSFPRTREPREKQSTPPNLPFAERRGRVPARRGCPKTTNTAPSKLRTPRQPLHHPPTPSVPLRHSRKPYVIPGRLFPQSLTSFPRTREPREKQSTPFPPKPTVPFRSDNASAPPASNHPSPASH